MDIAKYIGLFLLKNHFCYVHGLGNLELHKRPSTHDGKVLNGPSYEIVVTPGGSIDDNLANFIAVNEQISISKAANALRDFSMQARKDMAAGKEVYIPNLGKFVEVNGRVGFVTDANFQFTPAAVPTIKNSKQLEEQNAQPLHKATFPAPHKVSSVNWSMLIIALVLVLIVGSGIYGIYYYMNFNNKTTQVPVKDTTIAVHPVAAPAPDTSHVVKDTTKMAAAPATPATPDSLQVIPIKMIIGEYHSKEKADRRFNTLTSLGNHVEIVQKDSADYLIVNTVNSRTIDTAHAKDSLRILFGYKKVRIYQQ